MSRIETIELTDELHAQIAEAAERREREWGEEAADRLLLSFGPAASGWYAQRIIELETELRFARLAADAAKAWRTIAAYTKAVVLSGAPLVDLECGVSDDGTPFVVAVLEPRPPGSVFVDKRGGDYGNDAFVERIEKQVREVHPDLVYPPTERFPMGVRVLSVRDVEREAK